MDSKIETLSGVDAFVTQLIPPVDYPLDKQIDSAVLVNAFADKEVKALKALSHLLEESLSDFSKNQVVSEITEQLILLNTNIEKLDSVADDAKPTLWQKIYFLVVGIDEKSYFMEKVEALHQQIDKIGKVLKVKQSRLQSDNKALHEGLDTYHKSLQKLVKKIEILVGVEQSVKEYVTKESVEVKKVLMLVQERLQALRLTVLVKQQAVMTLEVLVTNNYNLLRSVERVENITITLQKVADTIALSSDDHKALKALKVHIAQTISIIEEVEFSS